MKHEDPPSELSQQLYNVLSQSLKPQEMREKVATLLEAGAEASFARVLAVHHRRPVLDLLHGQPILNLMDAAIDGNLDAVKLFILAGASPNEADFYGQNCPLNYAAGGGHTEVVSFLLGVGADPNLFKKPWHSPLVFALRDGHIETAAVLWQASARAESLLFQVVKSRAPAESVAWVVAHVPDSDRVSGLHQSIHYKNLSAVEWFLDAGVDIDCRWHSQTCLMTAAEGRGLAFVELLIARGCDVHAVDINGRTAMHYAICRDHLGDPDFPRFDYVDSAVELPVAKALLAAGLAVPARE